MSWEGGNGAYAWNREGGNVAPVGVVVWLYAWKLRGRGLIVSCVGAGSVKALRDPVICYTGGAGTRDIIRLGEAVKMVREKD